METETEIETETETGGIAQRSKRLAPSVATNKEQPLALSPSVPSVSSPSHPGAISSVTGRRNVSSKSADFILVQTCRRWERRREGGRRGGEEAEEEEEEEEEEDAEREERRWMLEGEVKLTTATTAS